MTLKVRLRGKRKKSDVCHEHTFTCASSSEFNPREMSAIMTLASRGGCCSRRIVNHQDGQENDTISENGNNSTCDEADKTWVVDPNKKIIEPDHGNNFKPNPTEVVHMIVKCMTSKYDQPWASWKKVPQDIRDMWFDEFQKVYQWHPQHSCQIRKIFETRGGMRLKNYFNIARKVDKRPIWMDDSVWKQLEDQWKSEDFKAKSEQAKKNRASDVDGLGPSHHTGGSIPMTEHKRRLEAKTGKEVSDVELFLATHQRKDQTWIDNRAAQTYEQWSNAWNDMEVSQENSGSQSIKLMKDQLWAKYNTTKKGTIYGLGTEGGKYKNPTHGHFASSSHSERQSDGEKKMAEEIEALRKENVHQTEEMKKMGEQMQVMVKMLTDLKDKKKKKKEKRQEKKKRRLEEEVENEKRQDKEVEEQDKEEVEKRQEEEQNKEEERQEDEKQEMEQDKMHDKEDEEEEKRQEREKETRREEEDLEEQDLEQGKTQDEEEEKGKRQEDENEQEMVQDKMQGKEEEKETRQEDENEQEMVQDKMQYKEEEKETRQEDENEQEMVQDKMQDKEEEKETRQEEMEQDKMQDEEEMEQDKMQDEEENEQEMEQDKMQDKEEDEEVKEKREEEEQMQDKEEDEKEKMQEEEKEENILLYIKSIMMYN